MTTSPSKQHSEKVQSADLVVSRTSRKRPVWEVVAEIGAQIPDEEWAEVPSDGSINYKHYLYGASKQVSEKDLR